MRATGQRLDSGSCMWCRAARCTFSPNGAFSFCSLGAAPPDWLRTAVSGSLGQPRAGALALALARACETLCVPLFPPACVVHRCTGRPWETATWEKNSNTIAEGAAFSPGVPGQRLPVDLGRHSVWGAVWVLRSGEQRRDRRCGLVVGAVVLRCCGCFSACCAAGERGQGRA